jgi:hypothetical protein
MCSDCELTEPVILACPICDERNLHLGPVSATQAADTIIIGYSRTLGGPILSHEFSALVTERGSRIRIVLVGECGHAVALCFWFHKGVTFHQWETIPGDSEDLFASTLWRD